MSRHAKSVAQDFVSRLERANRTRVKAESLFSRRELTEKELESIYSGLFLAVICDFESLIEDLFRGMVSGSLVRAGCKSRIVIRSAEAARQLILHGENYVTWLPFSNTRKLAEVYFYKGFNPFNAVTADEEGKLKLYQLTRNAVAHRSDYALSQFNRYVLSNLSLLPQQRHPAAYLRTIYQNNPDVTRFEDIIANMASVAKKIGGR